MTYAESLERPTRWLLWNIINQLEQLETKVETIMAFKDDLLATVEKIDNLKTAVVTYIDTNNSRIDKLEADLLAALAGNTDAEAIATQGFADMRADADEVFAKLTAGTPAEEPPA